MLPGLSKIVKCPKCGQEKEVFQMATGNTFGARFWSDGKISGPMLWPTSPIVKCDECGSYYRQDNQPERYSEDSFWGDNGVFNYEELKAAKVQLEEEGTPLPEKFLVLLAQAYNDKFLRIYREEVLPVPTDEDKQYFRDIVDTLLLEPEKLDPVLVAELQRETERFDECIEQLEKCNEEGTEDVVRLIREAAKAHYPVVFNLKEPPQFQ